MVSVDVGTGLLIILTDVDGLYDGGFITLSLGSRIVSAYDAPNVAIIATAMNSPESMM